MQSLMNCYLMFSCISAKLTATMKKPQAHSPSVLSKNASQQTSRARGTEQGPGSKSGDNQMWISSVQLLSCARLFTTWCATAHQASLSITNSRSLLKLMSIESVMPSNHFILCCRLLLPASTFRHIRVSSNMSALRIGGQSIEVSASTSVLPMNIQD